MKRSCHDVVFMEIIKPSKFTLWSEPLIVVPLVILLMISFSNWLCIRLANPTMSLSSSLLSLSYYFCWTLHIGTLLISNALSTTSALNILHSSIVYIFLSFTSLFFPVCHTHIEVNLTWGHQIYTCNYAMKKEALWLLWYPQRSLFPVVSQKPPDESTAWGNFFFQK